MRQSNSLPPALLSLSLLFLTAVSCPAYAQEGAEGEDEEIVVQATRSGRRLQDEPIRVEVITQEEIDEKLLMTPGNIAMLVSETPGVRVQVTSPALGASNVRIQGLRGRYTQLLTDGLPLFGGQASSIGLLQIPPTDLGRVEIIKGAASALYGPSALGGVINLVARRPGDTPTAEFLVNANTRDGHDLTAYASTPLADHWSASLTGGFHRQRRQDLDEDGWIDTPGYDRWAIRPRLFWTGEANALLTFGAMGEDRRGGTLPGRNAPDGVPFPQMQDTLRLDGGLTAQVPLRDIGTLHVRASAMTQRHRHLFGDVAERDRHSTYFAESSLSGGSDRTTWLVGLAWQADRYRSRSFPTFDYEFTVPAAFAQLEHNLADNFTLAGSARLDAHSEYGIRLSPRLSLFYRPAPFRVRLSLGRGFYAPTPFVEEIEAAGLSRLEPLAGLEAEVADTAALDIGYAQGPVEATLTLFGSNIDGAVRLDTIAPDRVRLINADGTTRTRGAELLLRFLWRQVTLTGSYVYLDATEPDPSGIGRRTVPVTPRHTAGMVAMWEQHGRGRIGVEAYYTGRQELEDNPYRTRSRPYVELGLLGELILGRVSLFVNLENILNVRQTRTDPILRQVRAADGRWTVDAWAPTDGFVANGGVRFRFGGG